MVRYWGSALILVLFLNASPAFASFSLHLDSVSPSTITSLDQEVTIQLSLEDLPSPSYFRVAFQKSTGGAYFGYMKNNAGGWVKIQSLSSDCHDYFYQSDASASAIILTLKVGSDNPIDSGTYNLNAHRLTSSACTATSADNPLPIEFSLPIPTSTSSPTATPVPTVKPSATPKPAATPTKIPASPTLKASPTASPTLSNSPSPSATLPASPSAVPAAVLGMEISLAPSLTPLPSPQIENHPAVSFPWLAVLLVGVGLILLSGSIVIYRHSSVS